MSRPSLLAVLGLQPDPLRAVWDGMSGRDRDIIARSAGLVSDHQIDEHQSKVILPRDKTWDKLTHGQQIAVRATMRRFASWCKAVNIIEQAAA